MSDGITDATKHEHELIEDWQRKTIDNFLKDLSKEELIDELCKRDGVSTIIVEPNQYFAIRTGTNSVDSCQYGAAKIIVVRE